MFLLSVLAVQDPNQVSPPPCKPFTLRSNVCVGDLVAIVACSIAGVGFFFWSIHAIRKMREFPFTYDPEDEKEESNDRADPNHAQSAFDDSLHVQRGASGTLSPPERVRTRMLLTQPDEGFYRSAPISSEPLYPHTGLRMPPRAGGPSYQRTYSCCSSRPLIRSGEGYEYGMNGEYARNVIPSGARGSPVRVSHVDYVSRQSMRRGMNREPITYDEC